MAEDTTKMVKASGAIAYTNPDADVPSIYVNSAEIMISNWDLRLRLGQIQDIQDGGAVGVKNLLTVFMSIEHARVFAEKVQQTLAAWDANRAATKTTTT